MIDQKTIDSITSLIKEFGCKKHLAGRFEERSIHPISNEKENIDNMKNIQFEAHAILQQIEEKLKTL